MEPFIARYRQNHLKDFNEYPPSKTRYDVMLEQSVVISSSKLLIDSAEMIESITGTYITEAQTDPTSDEPTER